MFVATYILFKYSGQGGERKGRNTYHPTLTHDSYGEFSPHAILTGVGYFAVTLLASLAINLEWLKIWIAPKLWLIEYAAQLVK